MIPSSYASFLSKYPCNIPPFQLLVTLCPSFLALCRYQAKNGNPSPTLLTGHGTSRPNRGTLKLNRARNCLRSSKPGKWKLWWCQTKVVTTARWSKMPSSRTKTGKGRWVWRVTNLYARIRQPSLRITPVVMLAVLTKTTLKLQNFLNSPASQQVSSGAVGRSTQGSRHGQPPRVRPSPTRVATFVDFRTRRKRLGSMQTHSNPVVRCILIGWFS